MSTLRTERNVPGLPKPNEVRLVLADALPPAHLITSALGLFFLGDSLLMARLASRGWDLPGGHVEPGESPEAALRREVREETGAALGAVRVLGYEAIVLLGPKPEAHPYPFPTSYQAFYCGEVGELHRFAGTAESLDRGVFTPGQARSLAWVQRNRELYEAAFQMVVRKSAGGSEH